MVKNLRLLREENGMTQQYLADLLNISQQAVFKYERTANEPSIPMLMKMADIFGVTVDFLIGNSEIREKNVKKDFVLLTEQELSHIGIWRKLSPDIQTCINELLSNIIRLK